MSGMNRVTILGNLGADPEMKNTGRNALTQLRVGVTERWKNGNEWRERTEWVSVKCWGDGLGDYILRTLRKGSRVLIEGKLQTEQYEKNGEKRYATYVVVQGGFGVVEPMTVRDGGDGGQRQSHGDGDRRQRQDSAPRQQQRSSDGFDYTDEIPF